MLNKKLILITGSIIAIIILGGGTTYYFLNSKKTQTPANKQATENKKTTADKQITENPEISNLIDVDLSDSGLPTPDLPEVNMSFGFDQTMVLDDGSEEKLNLPEIDLTAPAVPEIAEFQFDPSGLENKLSSPLKKQPSNPQAQTGETTESQTNTQADAQAQAQAQADAQAQAQAQADAQAQAQAQADAQAQAQAQADAQAAEQAAKDAAAAKSQTNNSNEEETSPPAQTGPSAEDCAKFDSAPSCDYVPADVRDICQQCKN